MPKASDNIKIYRNPNGPVVSTVNRRVLEQDGLTFKDIDGTGTLSPVNDWRNSPAERAAAYVKTLSVKEKIAQLFISDWRMAKYPITGPMADLYKDIEKKTDETGILDEGEFRGKTIFGEQYLPGTSSLLKDWFNRHVILRANATPADLADWMNQADAVCEEGEHFIPVAAASNSRNENGELVFGMNDAGGVLATWPGTLGIAAAVKGSKIDLVDKFADTIRREWNACGLRKGYMYMADAVTDPRWQRTYGTFGEDPALISEIMAHIIPRIQGSDHGVTEDGVAVTTKHFPGGGARENGFDPHYAAGQWNVYATPGSLETYHLPPFAAAVKAGTSSIMPYYSKPAAAKSAVQHDLAGNTVEMKPYGFAYNKYFIDTMLRGQMGFDGYINSDTGIAHNMAWGVEMLDVPERIGFAVANAGVDIISGLFDNEAGMEAYNRGKNGYYETHPLPEGFAKEELTLTDEALDRAVARTLTELFALGMFENPYRDPDEAAAKAAQAHTDWQGVVQFEDVSFRYPGADSDALEHISFTAKPGETTAIIGSTGCGKSTLLNLIPRFYDVTGGKVTVDGIDVREMPQAQLHDLLGYVPQKGVLFSGTIDSNLKFGGEDITDAQVHKAAAIAQATDFIEAKPESYQSPIAQGGSNVSGGQKQRLSIARAIAKNPKVYLFDDSFSALDYKTDVTLRRALKAQTDNATVIIVAQRISTVLHANQILVLDEGRLVGKGTHAQLMVSCPEYQEIARSQLSQKELALDTLNTEKEGE